MGYIVWTKQFTVTDNGSILEGVDLQIFQSDITATINGNLTNINIAASAAIAESKLAFDITSGHDHDGSNSKLVTVSAQLSTDKTINFDNSMTVATMQALISVEPRYIPYGKALVFQFADGTYTINTSLVFEGFYGGGKIYIQGNESETEGLHTNQAVILDGSASDINSLCIISCSMKFLNIRFLRVNVKSTTGYTGILVENSFIWAYYNYILGNGTGNGYGFLYHGCASGYSLKNNVSNMSYGIASSYISSITSNNDADTGTPPLYGLYANIGSDIALYDVNVPNGSTADTFHGSGGHIWSADGTLKAN